MAHEHSVFFETYDCLVRNACARKVDGLGAIEVSVLAAFSKEFDEYSCSDTFMTDKSLEGFSERDAVIGMLYDAVSEFALNWAEERNLD